jgi:predicted nuclease with TOPRIM domain
MIFDLENAEIRTITVGGAQRVFMFIAQESRMSLKDSLQQKLETQADLWRKQVESLRAQAEEKMARAKDEQSEAEVQREFSEKIQDLEAHIDSAKSKLGELRDSSTDQLESLKKHIDDWLPGKR